MKMIATKVRDIDGFTGRAVLFKVTPEMEYNKPRSDDDPPAKTTDHVVVSATCAFTGPETYIFAADPQGNVISWGELAGSYKGGLSIIEALKGAGYTVAEGGGH